MRSGCATLADELGAEPEICDVADRAAVDALAARVSARHPPVKLLVNNAGVPGKADFVHRRPRADRERDAHQLLRGGSGACGRSCRRSQSPPQADVVNVVSVAGTVVLPQSGPYAASKHAQLAFSRAVAAQLRPRGIRVHTVLPGFSPTSGFPEPSVLPKALEWTVIEPERIAPTIVGAVAHDRRESFVPWWFRGMAVLQGSAPSSFSAA